jgi:hypothetical protein
MDAKRPLTTAQVPARFLTTAMLIGSTPVTVLNSDPRVSYNLYIPHPTTTQTQTEFLPPKARVPILPMRSLVFPF